MSRFYERWGYAIALALTAILGFGLVYAALLEVLWRTQFPLWPSAIIQVPYEIASRYSYIALEVAKRNSQYIGGGVTLATFVFGVVQGILLHKRQLPRRLIAFMNRSIAPIYRNTDAIKLAVAYPSATTTRGLPLFDRQRLHRALDDLGPRKGFRRAGSLDEIVGELSKQIEVTEKRLLSLQELKAHTLLLRGAVKNTEQSASEPDAHKIAAVDGVELDLSYAVGHPSTSTAALELRGLYRARKGNSIGALEDFAFLRKRAILGEDNLAEVRARRLEVEVQMRPDVSCSLNKLAQLQIELNDSYESLKSLGGTTDLELLELGYNREAYGFLKERRHDLNGQELQIAKQEYQKAIEHYRSCVLSQGAERAVLVARRLQTL